MSHIVETAKSTNPWAASNAPASKIKATKSKQATTKANLHLRKSASTSGKPLGVMKKGTKVTPTGKTSKGWHQLKWGSKTGWASGSYLSIKTVTTAADTKRYMNKYSRIYDSYGSKKKAIGGVNFCTQVTRLAVAGKYTHIKTAYYHGWVATSYLETKRPAVQYRWAGNAAKQWSAATGGTSKAVKAGTKVSWRRTANGRDQVLIGNKWVWVTGFGKSVPAATLPATVNVADYGRFTTGSTALRAQPAASAKNQKTMPYGSKVTVTHHAGTWAKIKYKNLTGYVPKSALSASGADVSFAVYRTLRTGQFANYWMKGYDTKMLGKVPGTDLYQLWNKDWTFMTPGNRAVVTEQFNYSKAKADALKGPLDQYEGTMRYQGKLMYKRQLVTMQDGSKSYTYKTSDWGTTVAKRSGRLITAADFLKRH
ncbi:MAG: SH3 domain-containing protein [Galactobacter sp.]